MHGTSSDGLFARETRAIREDGQCVVSDGATLGKEKLAAPYIETNFSLDITNTQDLLSAIDFVGHSYDRARDRVYHSLLLLGPHSGHRRRRLNRFLLQSYSPKTRRGELRRTSRQAAGATENGVKGLSGGKAQSASRSLSARKRTLPDVHAATLLVARDFPR